MSSLRALNSLRLRPIRGIANVVITLKGMGEAFERTGGVYMEVNSG
jgi:hypothetical protein